MIETTTFTRMQSKAEEHGLTLIQHTPWHWQIRGEKAIVNFYPTKGTVFVNGRHRGYHGTWEDALDDAIDMEFGPLTETIEL